MNINFCLLAIKIWNTDGVIGGNNMPTRYMLVRCRYTQSASVCGLQINWISNYCHFLFCLFIYFYSLSIVCTDKTTNAGADTKVTTLICLLAVLFIHVECRNTVEKPLSRTMNIFDYMHVSVIMHCHTVANKLMATPCLCSTASSVHDVLMLTCDISSAKSMCVRCSNASYM